MAVNVCVQCDDGFPPDTIILLTLCYYGVPLENPVKYMNRWPILLPWLGECARRLTGPLFPIEIEHLFILFFSGTVRQMVIKGI